MIALGTAVPAGWLLYDLAKVLVRSNPAAFTGLVPGAMLALAVGAVFGWGVSKRPWLLTAAVAVCGVASVGSALVDDSVPLLRVWLPRVAFLLAFAFLVGYPQFARRTLGTWRVGLCLGFLACSLAATAYTPGIAMPGTVTLAAVLVLLLGFVRPGWLRLAATVLVLAYPVMRVGKGLQRHLESLRPDLEPGSTVAAEGAPDLLLIVMDTVRADRLGLYGYERETTPRLDAFVRVHATQYRQARSTGSYTLPSHASMLTGLYSAEHGADHPRTNDHETVPRDSWRPAVSLRPDVPTLAERLRARGYRTGAILANSAYLHHDFGLDRGFEHYDDRDGAWIDGYVTLPQFFGWRPRIGRKVCRDGARITDAALSWIRTDADGRPCFLLLNYMDAHQPYIPPEDTARAFSEEQPDDVFHPRQEDASIQYDRCLLALDAHLGRLLDELLKSGALENTALIITADHGEAMGEHDDFFTHAWNLHDELVRVPLYVKPVGGRTREHDDTVVSGVDIPRLAFEAMGVEPELAREPANDGERILSEWYHGKSNPDIDAWAERAGRDVEIDLLAWIEGDVKFIVGSNGQVEAYDVQRDPGELAALDLSPGQIEAAHTRAQAWWAGNPPLAVEETELDSDLLDRLENLGYIGGDR